MGLLSVSSRYRYVVFGYSDLSSINCVSRQFARVACRVNGLCCCSQREALPILILIIKSFSERDDNM